MNKLIIIGNGFDRAHGLATDYGSFINKYLSEIIVSFLKEFNNKRDFRTRKYPICSYGDELVKISSLGGTVQPDRNFMANTGNGVRWINNALVEFPDIIVVKFSELLETIFNQVEYNWVDIENEYFNLLDSHSQSIVDVERINIQFAFLRNELVKYLKTQQKVLDPSKKLLSLFDKGSKSSVYQSCFLNFNYTNTIEQYKNKCVKHYNVNYIHGSLDGKHGQPIFGIGDEYDERYLKFKTSGMHKALLQNSKSQWYLRSENYRKLTTFIFDAPFEVSIFGHSCGSSDRTFLRHVFQHKNCSSIKVYYYDTEDDFFDRMLDLELYFDDPLIFRSKVRSLAVSQPMPQPKDEKGLNEE